MTDLMQRSPSQGVNRFRIHYNVRQVTTEDRMLRQAVLSHMDAALGRRSTPGEGLAMNWAIDLMLGQAVSAFVEHQNARRRESAEAELRYLSFLSHDLKGNLGNVTL